MLQHAALETRRADGEAATAFWRLLGFVAVEPPPTLREQAAWLQRGPTQIHLLWSDDPVAPPRAHVAVVVDDYEATLERVREAGHDVEERPGTGEPRARSSGRPAATGEVMAAPP